MRLTSNVTRVLDADIIIDVQRHYPPALFWYTQLVPGEVAIAGPALMELYQNAQNARQVRAVDALVAPHPIVWPGDAEASRAASLFRTLHLSHGIGLLDMLNAAAALTLPAPLCTFNIKHYRLVPGLATEQPYER